MVAMNDLGSLLFEFAIISCAKYAVMFGQHSGKTSVFVLKLLDDGSRCQNGLGFRLQPSSR
jgi:hypothetical protein